MHNRVSTLFLILVLTLSTHLSWAQQRKEVLQAKVLLEAIVEAYGNPICSEEIKEVERLIGLEENYMADKLKALKIAQSNFCSDPKYKNYCIYEDDPANEIRLNFQNIGECNFFLNSVFIKQKWSAGTQDNVLPQLIRDFNIPALAERSNKKSQLIYKVAPITLSNGKSYDLMVTYENIGETSWENARNILGLEKIPKNHSILTMIELYPPDEIKQKMRTGDLDLDACKDSKQRIAELTPEMIEKLRFPFKNMKPEEFAEHNLPREFEDWVKLATYMVQEDSDRTIIIANDLVPKNYYLDSKQNRYVRSTHDELSWIGRDLVFEKRTPNHWDGFTYYYGAPIGLGMVRTSYDRKLTGYYFLGMPHGLMQEYKSKSDSSVVMYHFGQRVKDQITVQKNGIQVRYYVANGDTLYDGLVDEIRPDGTIAQTIYKNGKRQEVLQMRFQDGSVFKGPFNASLQPQGYGEWYFDDPAKHKGFSLVRGTFKAGKPIQDSLYLVNFSENKYFVETTIDENRLPHSPEGFKAVTWAYRRPEKNPTLVNFEHGVPTTIKDPNVNNFDFKGYPKGLEIMSYHGEVDSLLTPHGKGRINVYEGYGAINSWTGVFNRGVLTEGEWEEEPFLRAKRAKAYREREESGVAQAQEIEGYLRANFPSNKYNVSLVSSGSEAVVSIRNQTGDFRVAIFDRNKNSAGVKAQIKSITRGGNTMANQEQGLGGTYSFASSSNVQVIFMTPNDALIKNTIMRGGADSMTVSLTPTSSGSYLYVYLITPK